MSAQAPGGRDESWIILVTRWVKKLTRICRRMMFCRMSRRTTVVSANPHLIFQSGEAFLNVCRTVNDEIHQRGNPHILPLAMAVNSALALELFLKCLRTIESGGFSKGHEFDQQYYDLQKSTRDEIRQRHDKIEASAPFFATLRKRGFKTDLDSLLEMGRKTFVNFRYAFEPAAVAQKTTWALDDFMFIVRDIILEKHHEWTPKYPPPRSPSVKK
jgi:hypothetical protein